jgi:integrase family protein with SAM-like domain
MDFVHFLGLRWPDESTRLFTVSVADVIAFRDQMLAEAKAPKTINRRIASLSSFYKYLQGVPSEFRLPITVPNPAHAQFIPHWRLHGWLETPKLCVFDVGERSECVFRSGLDKRTLPS